MNNEQQHITIKYFDGPSHITVTSNILHNDNSNVYYECVKQCADCKWEQNSSNKNHRCNGCFQVSHNCKVTRNHTQFTEVLYQQGL